MRTGRPLTTPGLDGRPRPHDGWDRGRPVVLGHEVAGEVLEVGPQVRDLRPGDRVAVEPQIACMSCSLCLRGLTNLCQSARRPGLGWGGTFAEFMIAPERVVYRLGDDTPFELGALVEPAAVAMRAFRRGEVRLGDRVAVLGAGPIGGLIAHISQRAHPGVLMVSDIKPFNLRFIESLGIENAMNASEIDVVEAGRELTGGEGSDVVFVTSPNDSGLTRCRPARPAGWARTHSTTRRTPSRTSPGGWTTSR